MPCRDVADVLRRMEDQRLEATIGHTSGFLEHRAHAMHLLVGERRLEHPPEPIEAAHHTEVVVDGVEQQGVENLAQDEEGARIGGRSPQPLAQVGVSFDVRAMQGRDDDQAIGARTNRGRKGRVEPDPTVAVIL